MSKRKFFSGNSVRQAVVSAASFFDLSPDEVAYREVDKKHGFLKMRKKVIIEVDADDPSRPPAEIPAIEPEPADRSRGGKGGQKGGGKGRGKGKGGGGRRYSDADLEHQPPPDYDDGGGRRPPQDQRQEEVVDDDRGNRESGGGGRGGQKGGGQQASGGAQKSGSGSRGRGKGGQQKQGGGGRGQQQQQSRGRDDRRSASGTGRGGDQRGKGGRQGGGGDDSRSQGGRDDRGGQDQRGGDSRKGQERRDDSRKAGGNSGGGGRGRGKRGGRKGGRDGGKGGRDGGNGGRGGGNGGRGGGNGGRGGGNGDIVELPERSRSASERYREEATGPMADACREALERVLDVAGIDVDHKVFEGEDRFEVDLFGPDEEMLVAQGGDLLRAVEHLVPRAMRGVVGESTLVRVNCGDFHEIHEERLRSQAQQVAAEVRKTNKPSRLEPMSPADRRIVHVTLADEPGVTTNSDGNGHYKQVVVKPA